MSLGAALSLAGSVAVLALLLLGVSAGARSGALVRNGAVGLRTRATRASDEAWAVGHRAAARALTLTGRALAGAAVLMVAAALLVGRAQRAPLVLGLGGLAYAVLVGGLVVAVRRADAAARAVTS